MISRLLIFCSLALWTITCGRAALFDDANKLYEQGKYPEAIRLYENLLHSGHHSPGVLFNLGNAHFKNGELGRAILYYHRAQRVVPRDPDVRANLRFARQRVSGSLSVQPGLVHELLNRFTLNEIAGVTALLFWVWMALLCAGKWQPSLRPALRGYTTVFGAIFAASLLVLLAAYSQERKQIAIITGPRTIIHLGPLEESQTAFTATDGTELRILAAREGWLQVADRSGRTGWIPASAAAIFPDRNIARPSRHS